jgi:hypothetical protein
VFENKSHALNVERAGLFSQIKHNDQIISARRDSLNAEADGRGGSGQKGMKQIWKSKYDMYQADSAQMTNENKFTFLNIGKIDNTLISNNALMIKEIKELPDQDRLGINKTMQLLHEIIWQKGNFTNKFMSILILLISMIFELTPLISKTFYDTSEYFGKKLDQREVKDKETALAKTRELNLVGRNAMLTMKMDEIRLTREYAESKLLDTVKFNKTILQHTTDELNRLQLADRNLQKRYPKYYAKHLKPLIEKSYTLLYDASASAISS